jgi:hypothetical protein
MSVIISYDAKIEATDPEIFLVESQTTRNDRLSLLRLQRLVRRENDDYCYLEIGSHLGGSLLPHLADSRCGLVISIDPRPAVQSDERGPAFAYQGNSTQRMVDGLLRHLPEDNLAKLQTFDLDASVVPRAAVARAADLALIDGEHTNVATVSDFLSIIPFLADDAIVVFHDSNLIFDAITHIEQFHNYLQIPFQTVFLPDQVAAIALRGMADALQSEMIEIALRRDRFIASARRFLQTSIAMDVLDRNDMGFMTPMKRIVRMAIRKHLPLGRR